MTAKKAITKKELQLENDTMRLMLNKINTETDIATAAGPDSIDLRELVHHISSVIHVYGTDTYYFKTPVIEVNKNA